MKACTACGQCQPLTEFHRNTAAGYGDGYHPWCKSCRRVADKARRAKDPAKTAEQQQRRSRKWKYGLTTEQFDALAARHGGQCAICEKFPEQLVVDHDHATGIVRGLLCRSCNLALGNVRDSIATLERAVAYLKAGG